MGGVVGQVQPTSFAVSRFRVEDLHGLRTIDIPIENNSLVLVGENGTSKSTVANLLFYVLTRQWHRLRRFRFSTVEVVLNGHSFVITPEILAAHDEYRHRISSTIRHLPPPVRDYIVHIDNEADFESALQHPYVMRSLFEMGLTRQAALEIVRRTLHDVRSTPAPALESISREIASLTAASQVLYLPTYRRIEQDLQSIFPGTEIEPEIKKVRDRLARRGANTYTELVAFGMEDVERTIDERLAQIKDSVRKELNNLTGTYLRDVLRGVHSRVTFENVRALDPTTLDAIFARIDETTLPKSDQSSLREKVATMQRSQVQPDDKVIAHFLSKLLELYREQQTSETDVRSFVKVCNGYLSGKYLVYDDVKYELTVRPATKENPEFLFPDMAEPLSLKVLSSGEKQIISLFSHIYLTRQTFFVIIDEPELSLSVPWQRRFLPDILRTEQCSGLVAVTHSPFIFDNELEPYVRSIMEFTRTRHAEVR